MISSFIVVKFYLLVISNRATIHRYSDVPGYVMLDTRFKNLYRNKLHYRILVNTK